ncbi:hypothetical protein U9M48_005189 [Paspalum notatum var. saurae]|uniref:Uncharacterized protein n=1 Tax=Paspalum notatum var. saurae TaxID=547442 RepID=A0AAQ3SFB6_PASNO
MNPSTTRTKAPGGSLPLRMEIAIVHAAGLRTVHPGGRFPSAPILHLQLPEGLLSLRDRKTSALPGRRLRLHRPGCCHRPSAPPPEADPIDDFPEGLRAYCVRPAALYDEAPAPDEVAAAKHQHPPAVNWTQGCRRRTLAYATGHQAPAPPPDAAFSNTMINNSSMATCRGMQAYV